MRKSMVVFIALAVLAVGGAAWAAGTNTLTVQANVTGTCKFNTASSTLDFLALDPSSAVNVNGTATTQFWCTKGVVATFPLAGTNGAHWSGTSRQMAGPGVDLIPYSLTLTPDALASGGPTVLRSLTLSGTVLGADYSGVTAGNYSDTVTLTINP